MTEQRQWPEADEEVAYVNARWDAMRTPSGWDSLLTQHLPVEVVSPDLSIWIANTTNPEEPREAALQTAVRLGERENPDLTSDDAEYVVATLLAAARTVWRRHGDGRPVPQR